MAKTAENDNVGLSNEHAKSSRSKEGRKENTKSSELNKNTDEDPEEDRENSFEEGGIKFDDIYVPPPPATAFQASPDGSRLIITHIVNENFKSYADVQYLGPFHKYFTAIIGPNGSGKSNVIDSMLFVFGYRASKLRSKKISALLHDSPNHPKVTSCTVTVHFAMMTDNPDDVDGYQLKPGSEFYISRTACIDNSSYYTINGKKVQFKEVGKLLRNYGIDLDHNRFLILQGEVEQISLMKPKAENEHEVGMLEYLEDIIGSSRFKEPINQLMKRVELQSEVRDEKWNRCKMAKSELDDLKAPMEAALKYVQLENSITFLNHKLLQKKILMGEIEGGEKKELLKKIEDQLKELKKNLEEKRKEIKEKESANSHKTKELERLLALKENVKAAFEANKLHDLSLQQAVESANKKRKETAKALAAEEEKKIKLEKVPEKNREMIEELEAIEPKTEEERQAAEKKHAEVMESLAQDTEALQEEKETLQTELVKLKEVVDKTKSKYDMSKTELELYKSQEENEKSKLDDLRKRLEETKCDLKKKEEELKKVSSSVPLKEEAIKRKSAELDSLKSEESYLSEERRKQQLNVEETRVALQSNRGRGKVLDFLMQQKLEGKIPGIFGRMGDLGGIDEKYDVAISTACGPLDNIVVDTVDTATACIDALKKNNIGSATFVALEKQEHFRSVYSKPFRAPENVPRLFDLIKVADERIRPVFYYALQDTLVANNLDQAVRIAYGKTRYRVVTLTGDLIEIAGTMTGGGNQVFRGRMGRKVEQQTEAINPKELDSMERRLAETLEKLSILRRKINTLEDELITDESDLKTYITQKNKLDLEIPSLRSQLPMLQDQLKNQEVKYKNAALDQKKLSQLNKAVLEAQKEYERAKDEADVIEKQVNKLHAEIIAKTKGRLESAQKKLDEATEKLDKIRKEKTRLKVAIITAERNIKKAEERISNMKQEIEECVERIKKSAADIKENEVKAQKTLEEYQKCEEELQALEEENSETKQEMDGLLEQENALKTKEIDLKQDLSKAKSEVEQRQHKIMADKKKMQSLKLLEEPLSEEKLELKELTPEELKEVDAEELAEEIKAKESNLPKNSPNLGVIQEYTKKQMVYLEREKDLERATNERNKTRSVLEEFRKTRLTEFMKGFSIITQKVKECYQMLADGGDAELELVNTLDPFLDGIRFTVRPPKKSWKEIQYLSGGEKTLSSLSLIFALHYYKPTPLYFMDEIDAALDWKNTAIVGLYLKEQTKNAQFIVVSLRENMFEIADQLVGIFKTNNCTKSMTIIPHTYSEINGDETPDASYFDGTSHPAPNTQQNAPELFDLIQSLQCGDTLISILPSVVYLIGIALLIHHIITMNIRPQLYRRVGRELLLQIPWQEILIFMLIYQCIRIWLSTLVLLNTVFKYYQKQLSLICPWGIKSFDRSNFSFSSFPMISKGFRDFAKIPLILFYIVTGIAPFNKFTNVSDIRGLHPFVQAVLAPRILKIVVCTLMSFIPFLALMKLKERRPLPQFMLWCIDCRMGPMRRDRSELGASGYYLERPISELRLNSAESSLKRSSSCNDIGQLKFRSRRTRSRKSVSMELLQSRIFL